MWLHIRGVGEWTNRLYAYFEKEQERLHSGEIQPVIIGSNCSPMVTKRNDDVTGTQTTFLSQNMELMKKSNTPFIKSNSADVINIKNENNERKKSEDNNEQITSFNDFDKNISSLVSKLSSTSDLSTTNSAATSTRYENQHSEKKTIKKIQA